MKQLSPGQILETPLLNAIKIPQYQSYMLSPNQWFFHDARLRIANEEASAIFGIEQNVRNRWNQVMLWKPILCWKAHENRRNGFRAYTCENRNNPCCGHPELNGMIHTLGLGAWTCVLWGHRLKHPMHILDGLLNLDHDSWDWYGSTDYSNPNRTPEEIHNAEKKVKEEESRIYSSLIHPYMLEISSILSWI